MTLARAYLIGAGKLGTALARGLRRAGLQVTLRPWRRGLPKRRLEAELVIVAVRDAEIEAVARALAGAGLLGHQPAAVIHCAGAHGPELLEPVRGPRVAIGRMHPLASFADDAVSLAGCAALVGGQPRAVALAKRAARLLGMRPVEIEGLDPVLYHASAAVLANGAAALAHAASLALERAGVPRDEAGRMLGPLLATVAANVERLGLPEALTGPVRRGDVATTSRHLARIRAKVPEIAELYREVGRAQIPLARALGEAEPGALARIERLLRDAETPGRPRR